jgi:hypothetical protein
MEPCVANVFLNTTNEMQRYTMFFIVVSALHVSSGFSAHHQELKNCICSFGTCQTCVLFSVAWLSRNCIQNNRQNYSSDSYTWSKCVPLSRQTDRQTDRSDLYVLNAKDTQESVSMDQIHRNFLEIYLQLSSGCGEKALKLKPCLLSGMINC